MKRPRLILVLVSMGAILAAGFWLYEWRRAVGLIAAASNAQAQFDELQRRFQAGEQDLQHAVRTRLDLERVTAAPGVGNAVGESAETGQNAASAQQSPAALRTRYLNAYRASLDGSWGLLFQILGLGSDQIARLEDLLVQREENNLRVQQTAQARGLEVSAPEIQAFDDQLDSANKAAIKALLGSADYNSFREYYHARPVLPVVSDLAGATYASDHPLTTDQARQLISVLADSSAKTDSGGVVKDTIDWDQAMARAQNLLVPDQLAALAALQEQYKTGDRLKQFTRNLTAPASASGPKK